MADKPMLTRDEILGADDLTSSVVEVPEWGGCVRVRAMSAAERDAFDEEILKRNELREDGVPNASANITALLVALTAIDDAGERLFTEADIEALGAKSGGAMARVFNTARALNRLTNADIEAAEGN